jgi:hypothetical protein
VLADRVVVGGGVCQSASGSHVQQAEQTLVSRCGGVNIDLCVREELVQGLVDQVGDLSEVVRGLGVPLLHHTVSRHDLRPRAEVLELDAGLEEAADAPECLDILEKLAKPCFELLARHPAA